MRRSNRLVFLIGLFLAVVAFVAVFLLLSGPGNQQPGDNGKVTEVIAAQDIPLGTKILDTMVTTQQVAALDFPANAYKQTSLVVGQVARRSIVKSQLITSDDFLASAANIEVPVGLRGISVQVDQVTGVGTLIKPGDFVDMVVGFTSAQFPVVTVNRTAGTAGNPGTTTITPVTGLNATSVKILLQGMQVLGTLLPTAAAAPAGQPGASAAPALNGQQEIVILGVPAQYAEVIDFAQVDNDKITLILRSSKDCVIPGQASPSPVPSASPSGPLGASCSTTDTTGVILKTLLDKYGVLVPQLVQGILPSPTP